MLGALLPATAGETNILPGAVIQFKAKTAACLTRETLLEYKAQTVRGDKSKIHGLLFEFGGHGCVLLGPGKRFKVIAADYNPGSTVGILEIIAVGAVGNAGTWALAYGVTVQR